MTDPDPLLPWSGGLVRAMRRHAIVSDSVLVALLAVPTFGHLAAVASPWWVAVLAAAQLGPLIVRRQRPYAVFWVVAALAVVLVVGDRTFLSGPVVLLALYTVCAHEVRRRAVLAAMVTEALALATALRSAPGAQAQVASVVFLSGLVAAALFIGTTIRTRRAYLAALQDRAERAEREREQLARLAVAAERTRIAREMHDVVSHGLSVMVALADGALAANRDGAATANEAMRLVSSTGRTSMAEMRRLLGVLRQDDAVDLAPQPGLDGLDDLVEQVRATGLPVVLRVRGTPRPLPPTQETIIYRVVQEALTNAMRHALRPSGVQVSLSWGDREVGVEIVDDGRAVSGPQGRPGEMSGDRAGEPSAGGHGLAGMRERAALFSGSLAAGPRPGGGWAVRAVLPIDVSVDGPTGGVPDGPTGGVLEGALP